MEKTLLKQNSKKKQAARALGLFFVIGLVLFVVIGCFGDIEALKVPLGLLMLGDLLAMAVSLLLYVVYSLFPSRKEDASRSAQPAPRPVPESDRAAPIAPMDEVRSTPPKKRASGTGFFVAAGVLLCLGGLLFLVVENTVAVLGVLFWLIGVFPVMAYWQKNYDANIAALKTGTLTADIIHKHIGAVEEENFTKFFVLFLLFAPLPRLLPWRWAWWLPLAMLSVGLVVGLWQSKKRDTRPRAYTIQKDVVTKLYIKSETVDIGDVKTPMVIFEKLGEISEAKCHFFMVQKIYGIRDITPLPLQVGDRVYLVLSKKTGKPLCSYLQKEWRLGDGLAAE